MNELRIKELSRDERLYWEWAQEQGAFTRKVVLDLLLKLQSERDTRMKMLAQMAERH